MKLISYIILYAMTPEEANHLQKHSFAGWYSIQPAIRVSNNIVFVTYQKEDTE